MEQQRINQLAKYFHLAVGRRMMEALKPAITPEHVSFKYGKSAVRITLFQLRYDVDSQYWSLYKSVGDAGDQTKVGIFASEGLAEAILYELSKIRGAQPTPLDGSPEAVEKRRIDPWNLGWRS